MRVAVTGGSGLIGQHAVRSLAAAGHEVAALARGPGGAARVGAAGGRAVVGDVGDARALATLPRERRRWCTSRPSGAEPQGGLRPGHPRRHGVRGRGPEHVRYVDLVRRHVGFEPRRLAEGLGYLRRPHEGSDRRLGPPPRAGAPPGTPHGGEPGRPGMRGPA